MDIKQKIEQVLTDILDEHLFVVEINFQDRKPSSKLTILLDGDEGVSIDACAEISRKLGGLIEENSLIESAYTLEVSSPGVDRPLELKRQYLKNIGRKLKLVLNDGSLETGTLENVAESTITIKKEPESKKKNIETEAKVIALQDINKANVLISFK